MGKHPIEKIKEDFGEIDDPRRINRSHLLIAIIVLAICGLISGADNWVEIEIQRFLGVGHVLGYFFQRNFIHNLIMPASFYLA